MSTGHPHPSTTARRQINVAVVGCGYWGPNLVRNFRALPNCSFKAMCDLDESRLAHLVTVHPGVETTTDYKAMIARADIDAVAVAVPVRHHYPLAKAALEAGKHVLVEKPLAASVAECEELIELSWRKGLILMVGHTYVYSAPVRKIVELTQQGAIGEIRSVNTRRLNLGLFQQDINVTWDLAPHDISIILEVLGELPQIVNCQGNAHVTPGIEDVTNLSLTFSNNRFATIQSSWLEPRKVRDMTIVGSKRMIVYDDIEPMEKVQIYDVRVERPPFYDSFGEFQYSYHYGDVHIPRIEQSEPLRAECQHFLQCIEQGAEPRSGGMQGLAVVRILDAASQSLRKQGGPVFLRSNAPAGFPRLPSNGA